MDTLGTTLCLAFAACFGLILGSFFNVLIYRIPRDESIVFPGSRCPACGKAIRPWENIPVLSFALLRGHCSGCKATISWRYPLIEALTCVIAMLICWLVVIPNIGDFTNPWLFVYRTVQIVSLLVLIPIAVIDLDHYIIPDRFTLPGVVLGLVVSLLPGGITPLDSLLGILTGAGLLVVVGVLGELIFRKGEAMGGGDIKLMGFLGAVWGWKIALYGIVFGSFLGAGVGGGMMILRRLRQDHRIPFGPFLAAGTALAVAAGEAIITGYMDWLEKLLWRR